MARGQSHRDAPRPQPDAGSRSWLAQRSAITAKPIAASAGVVAKAALPQNLVMNLDQKEALFKKFIEWQRSSEN